MATENVWVSKNDCVKWNVNILDFFVEFIFGFNYFCTWRQLFDILLLLILRLLLWVNCWSLLVFMMMLLRNSSSEILWIIGFFFGWLVVFFSFSGKDYRHSKGIEINIMVWKRKLYCILLSDLVCHLWNTLPVVKSHYDWIFVLSKSQQSCSNAALRSLFCALHYQHFGCTHGLVDGMVTALPHAPTEYRIVKMSIWKSLGMM